MSVYMTEAEQIEAIKKWWKRYSNVITIVLSVVLLSMSAYKYWNWHQEKINQQASNTYEQLMVASANQDNKGVRAYANQLLNEYAQTVYADAARLTLAKLYVSKEKYSNAETELDYVAHHAKMPELKDIAKIRLARLLATEQSYDKALEQLSHVGIDEYMPVVNELRGDIYAARKQYQEAVIAYRKAITQVQANGMGNLFLEMKTNELVALTQSMKTGQDKTKTA